MKGRREVAKWSRPILSSIDHVSTIGAWLSCILLFLMSLLIGYEVVSRYIFNAPTGFADEISSYMLVGIVFLSNGWVLKEDGHIIIDLVVGKLSLRIQKVLNNVTNILSIVFLVLFTWACIELVVEHYHSGAYTYYSIIRMRSYIPEIVLPVGSVILTLQMIAVTYRGFIGANCSEEE